MKHYETYIMSLIKIGLSKTFKILFFKLIYAYVSILFNVEFLIRMYWMKRCRLDTKLLGIHCIIVI
jgi:hypothetical protein